MTECVVCFLVERIGDFLEEEIKLLSRVREEVEFVRDELERMTAFLRMADMTEERNPQVQVLVKQVRDVAFDMEDILDEFQHHLVQDQRKGFLLKATGSIKKLNYRHQIASQIRQIKSRIIAISKGHLRYKDVLDHKSESSIMIRTILRERRGDAALLDEDELVGIDNPKSQLLNWLLDESAFKVLSVVGMGGLGKTTLVKNVYNDDAAKRHFQSRAWITVSKSFEIEQLLKDLMVQLFRAAMQPIPQGLETMKSQELKEILKLFIQEGRSLIVLDDVWDIEAWDAIKYAFPRSNNGNRLMLTTRNSEVANASSIEFKGEIYCLKPLSFEMSWKLLCKKTFQERECPPHLVSIAQTILDRCKGLPLAIVAISGVLARKKQGNADEWDRVNRNLGNMLQENKLQSVSSILLLSYYDLPFYLQSCLLYMSMFPEDYEIARYKLCGLWIAEGFVEQKDAMTKFEVAENYLKELQARNLIQLAVKIGDGMREACSIHDLLREVLLCKSKDHNFATIVNGMNTVRWQERTRRLSIRKIHGKVHNEKQFSRIRSLLVFGASDFSIRSFGSDLRLLRVLDLEGTKNLDVFPKEITNLHHLRFLNLSYTNVSEIPSSIGKLQNLEILLLKGTHVDSLPATVVNLHHLSELAVHRAGDSLQGFGGISGMGCLTNITRLLYVEVNDENGTIEELGRLTQLRMLGIVNLKKENGAALCASIGKLTNLRNFALFLADEEEVIDLHNLSVPPQFLQRLYLRGRLEKIPQWITCLHNLTFLSLMNSRLMENENVLEPIQGLPNLESLYLQRASDAKVLCFKAGGFQKLKELWVKCSQALKHVEVEKSAMPNLKRLVFSNCPRLESVPLGIEDLGKLKYLEFADVSDNLINRIDKARGGEDLLRLQRIPEVRVFYSRDGFLHPYPLSMN